MHNTPKHPITKRGGQVGWYKPEAAKPALAIYRESTADPWRLCQEADVELPIASIDLGDAEETPGHAEMGALIRNHGYDQARGMVNVVLMAHPEHRQLLDYYLAHPD